MSRKSAHVLIFLCAVLMLAGDVLSETYVSRLPNHAGYHLVSVEDPLPAALRAPGVRPRHTVLVVIDGLRLDLATTMASVQRLRAEGQCRRTDVGPLSVSRPVYAVMSTGLEQDRTGSRNNDDQSPLAAESIWQVARQAGREDPPQHEHAQQRHPGDHGQVPRVGRQTAGLAAEAVCY